MELTKIRYFFTMLALMPVTYGATVVQQAPPPVEASATSGLAELILTLIIIGMFIFIVVGIFLYIIMKIYKMFVEYRRGKSDFIFKLYTQDLKQCNIGRNTQMKKRNWKLLWFFWKRKPVYMRNDKGFEVIGNYDGETYKKEGFYCIALHHKLGMFRNYDNIILIPLRIKNQLVSTISVEGNEVLVLDCEGIDQLGNTDYYYQPLIWNKDKSSFIDYNDDIQKTYFEKSAYRDIIKENLQSYRENVIKSIEANPNVQHNRRK